MEPIFQVTGAVLVLALVTAIGILLWRRKPSRGDTGPELGENNAFRVSPDGSTEEIEDDVEDIFDNSSWNQADEEVDDVYGPFGEPHSDTEEVEDAETDLESEDPEDSDDRSDTTGLGARIYAAIMVVPASLMAVFRWIFGKIRGFTTKVRYRLKQIFVSFVMGKHPNTSRLLATIVIGSGFVGVAGTVGLMMKGAETSASSAPVLTFLLGIATTPWAWVVAVAILARSFLFFGDRLFARVTARKSGYSYQTIRRLAEEAKQPDLDRCERVLVQSGDTAEEISSWVADAFDGNGHKAPSFNPPGEDTANDGSSPSETPALVPVDTAEPIDVGPGTGDSETDPDFWTQLRLFRLELASAVNLEGVLWRFLAPAALTFVGVMLWLGIWIQPYFLPVVIAISVFAGGSYYWMVDLRHRRRLEALRAEDEPTRWTDLVILTKTVEVPETTMYFGYHDGTVYASEDKHELADTLGRLAVDRLEGREPAPAIEETYAYLLKRYVPMLEAWVQEYEKKAIMDQLINTVANAPDGLLPRDILIEDVVEYDRRYVAWGLLFIGRGRDPDLVREVYSDLVRIHALTEAPVTVADTQTGEKREVIATSLGDEPLPPNVAQLRGEFSSLFGKRAFDTRYKAPDVDVATSPAPFVPPESHQSSE